MTLNQPGSAHNIRSKFILLKKIILACGSLAVLFLFEFVSGLEVSRRDNMDYHDMSLTLPLCLSVLSRVASYLWGAVSQNQVSLFECWRVTLLLPLRRLFRNVPSCVFIARPVLSPLLPIVSPAITNAEEFTAERIVPKEMITNFKLS